MYQNIRTNPQEAKQYRVFDKDTGKEITKIIWADDERGRFRRYRTDKKGNFVLNKKRDGIETILHTGRNIELRKIQQC